MGVDILPLKTCNLNCIYCELGETSNYVCQKGRYSDPEEIRQELDKFIKDNQPRLDVITVTASGEPTLHSELKTILSSIKGIADKPLAVLTNGTLMWDREVREALYMADIVLPSLDAATDRAFRRINRPCACIDLGELIQGLALFRKEFMGQLWLEVLFVKGTNDSEEEIEALSEAIDRIEPDKIQINTVARPPAESWALPLEYERLQELAQIFGERSEIAMSPPGKGKGSYKNLNSRIREILGRRPMTVDDMEKALGARRSDLEGILEALLENGDVEPIIFHGKRYFKRRLQV